MIQEQLYTAWWFYLRSYSRIIYFKSKLQKCCNVHVKVTTDGGSTFRHVGKGLSVDVSNTLVLDKPINLEPKRYFKSLC